MNKKLMAIAIAGVFSVPMVSQAGDIKISGFIDSFYTLSNDGAKNSKVAQFQVDQVEVDFKTDNTRIDIDNTAAGGALHIEQAYVTSDLMAGWSLKIGKFDSYITADNLDAPDMNMSSWSAVYDVAMSAGVDHFTGVSLYGTVGPASVSVSLVNDDTTNVAADDKQATTIALMASAAIMPELDVEFSFVSLKNGAGSVMDINFNYTRDMIRVNFDYLTSDFAAGYSLLASYDVGNGIGVTVRLDSMTPDDSSLEDETSTTLFVSYAMSDNLTIALEHKAGVNENGTNAVTGITDGNVTAIEFLSTF